MQLATAIAEKDGRPGFAVKAAELQNKKTSKKHWADLVHAAVLLLQEKRGIDPSAPIPCPDAAPATTAAGACVPTYRRRAAAAGQRWFPA